MSSLDRTLDTFLSAWSEPNPEKRRLAFEASCTGDILYADPTEPQAIRGLDALEAFCAAWAEAHPERHLTRAAGANLHHGVFLVPWAEVKAGAGATARGLFTGELDPDGRLARVARFR